MVSSHIPLQCTEICFCFLFLICSSSFVCDCHMLGSAHEERLFKFFCLLLFTRACSLFKIIFFVSHNANFSKAFLCSLSVCNFLALVWLCNHWLCTNSSPNSQDKSGRLLQEVQCVSYWPWVLEILEKVHRNKLESQHWPSPRSHSWFSNTNLTWNMLMLKWNKRSTRRTKGKLRTEMNCLLSFFHIFIRFPQFSHLDHVNPPRLLKKKEKFDLNPKKQVQSVDRRKIKAIAKQV